MLPAHDDGGVELAESGPAEVAEVELVPFRGPQGAYEISVPEGWVTASLEGDISDVGRETFPDDPEVAEGFQQLASTAPRSLLFMSIDPTEVTARTFGSNVNILRVPDPGGADQEELLADARQGIGQIDGEVTDDGTFMTPAGEAVRVAYELGPVDGIQYYVAVGGDVWTLTYTSDELPEEEPVADAVASTFTVGPGG